MTRKQNTRDILPRQSPSPRPSLAVSFHFSPPLSRVEGTYPTCSTPPRRVRVSPGWRESDFFCTKNFNIDRDRPSRFAKQKLHRRGDACKLLIHTVKHSANHCTTIKQGVDDEIPFLAANLFLARACGKAFDGAPARIRSPSLCAGGGVKYERENVRCG